MRGEKMTLQEAIDHCYEVANNGEQCDECKGNHLQLAEWLEQLQLLQEKEYVPETLQQCEERYVPPNFKYITCEDFGKTDGMSGRCWWCKEMTPYQWHMCYDKGRLDGLMRGNRELNEKQAIDFITNRKRTYLGLNKIEKKGDDVNE